MACIALDPNDRPPTAQAVADALSDRPRDDGTVADRPAGVGTRTVVMPPSEPTRTRAQTPMRPGARPPSRGPVAVLAIVLFIAGAAAGYLLVRAAGAGASPLRPPTPVVTTAPGR
jgi:hypothetical protein